MDDAPTPDIPVERTADLLALLHEIADEGWSIDVWEENAGNDLYQRGDYSGGFEDLDDQFTFSYYGPDGEIWFQLTLAEIERLVRGDEVQVLGRRSVY